MVESLLHKYSGAVPRYTSYPTAPHFHTAIGREEYRHWLAGMKPGQSLSLYLHIPYCDRLCWFCACHTKHTLKYEPIAAYLKGLKREIETVGALVGQGTRVTAVHFGGGSPTLVSPEDLQALMAQLRTAFDFAEDVEISVEMDPNDLDGPRYDALGAIGLTRASLGVQDFAPQVQRAINRIQTFEQTRDVVEQVRARQVRSVNCDILYGLPHQTVETMEGTVAAILSLGPDRVALFGYAHVPWMKKHQTLIPEQALPDIAARYRQMTRAAELLKAAGYVAIGIDHFAKAEDGLAIAAAEGRLVRNFQGYSDDRADAIIGLGASSIGQMPGGYVQNATATGDYLRMVEEEGLAAVRGVAFSADDRARRHVIERIMCDFEVSLTDLRAGFPEEAEAIIGEAQRFHEGDCDGLSVLSEAHFALTDRGRPFARSVAAVFDGYLANGRGRHSVAV